VKSALLSGIRHRRHLEGQGGGRGGGRLADILHDDRYLLASWSRVRKLCTGEPSSKVWVATLFNAASERPRGGDRMGTRLAFQIFISKQQLSPRLAHVLLDIVGQHAQQDVGTDSGLDPMSQ
jgi:hypothetical protein